MCYFIRYLVKKEYIQKRCTIFEIGSKIYNCGKNGGKNGKVKKIYTEKKFYKNYIRIKIYARKIILY